MINTHPQQKMKSSSGRAVESAIERSKISKTQTWRELIKNGREDSHGDHPTPERDDAATAESAPD